MSTIDFTDIQGFAVALAKNAGKLILEASNLRLSGDTSTERVKDKISCTFRSLDSH